MSAEGYTHAIDGIGWTGGSRCGMSAAERPRTSIDFRMVDCPGCLSIMAKAKRAPDEKHILREGGTCADCLEAAGLAPKAEVPKRRQTLDVAADLIDGQRREDYGPPEESFRRIADMWQAILGMPISSKQVCLLLAALKIARAANNPNHEDSWIDLAGYAGLGSEVSHP